MRRIGAQFLYDWIIASFGDPTLESTSLKVFSNRDDRQHRHDIADSNPENRRHKDSQHQ
jgi:hypothetical protein